MADELDSDLGNEQILEGAEELYSGIDEVLGMGAETQGAKGSEQGAEQQSGGASEQQGETGTDALDDLTKDGDPNRPRGEDGKFLPVKKDAPPEKAAATEKPAAEAAKDKPAEKTYPETIKSEKARHEFDNLRKLRDDEARRAESAEIKFRNLEKQFNDLQSKSGTASPEVKVLQQEVDKLKTERDELERVVSFKAVEETKAFKEEVTAKQDEAMSVLSQVVETYGLDGAQLDAALKERNRFKRLEMLGDLTEKLPERAAFVKGELQAAVDKWVAADAKSQELYANAKGNREFAEQERAQTEAQGSLERQKAFRAAEKEVVAGLSEKLPELAGDEATWKEILEKAGKVADFDKMPAKAKAFANLSSYMVKPLITKVRVLEGELQKMKDTMAARARALPGAGSGRESSPRDEAADGDKSLLDVLDETM